MSMGCVVLYWVGKNWKNIEGRDLIQDKDRFICNQLCLINTEQKSGELISLYHQLFLLVSVKRWIFTVMDYSLQPKILEHGILFNTNFKCVLSIQCPQKLQVYCSSPFLFNSNWNRRDFMISLNMTPFRSVNDSPLSKSPWSVKFGLS